MITRRRMTSGVAGLLASIHGTLAWPQRAAVRVCVGFPPGSAADVVARLVATRLAQSGVPHVVDNRAGAGGRLAVDNVRQSPADGSAMLVTPDAMMTIYPHVYRKLSYRPLIDLQPVTALCTVPLGFAVGPSVPAEVRTLVDFVHWAKANPAQSTYGTSGPGTTLHFTGWMLAQAAGLELTHVPYRGSVLALQDMAGGQIAASVNVLGELLPFAQAGKVRILAVSSPARSRFSPDTPSFRESGFEMLESMTWFGLFLPGKTPETTVAATSAAVAEALRAPDAREALAKMAMEPFTLDPQRFAALIKADLERWAPVVRQTGYTSDE